MFTSINRNSLIVRMLILLSVLSFGACELVDPSQVENPSITEDNLLANATGGATALVTGLRRDFAVSFGNVAFIGDLVSDNLDNRTSFYENALDRPRTITPKSFSYGDTYTVMLRVNALADFGMSIIIPNDRIATSEQIAEVRFYKALALLILSENYSFFPIVDRGQPMAARDAIQLAIGEFKTALTLTNLNPMRTNIRLGLARAYRLAGDKVNAAAEATAALAVTGGSNYVFNSQYDQVNITAAVYTAMVGRSTHDIQPLPRLDFLDPKYTVQTVSVPALKSEEAHLILAEVAIADNNLLAAKTSLKNAITLANSRPTSSWNDKDTRLNRPNDAAMTVKADANAPARTGLIQKRGGTSMVTVYAVSRTSVTSAMIDGLTTRNDHIYYLYLMRQEIFYLEGRRMSDLGIRLPVVQRQIDANPNITEGSPAATVVVPSFIPLDKEWKEFSISGTVVTIKFDMNKLIVDNISKVSPLGL